MFGEKSIYAGIILNEKFSKKINNEKEQKTVFCD